MDYARVKKPVRRKPSWDLSIPGLLYFIMMMVMGLAAMNTQANLLFAVFGLMIGVLIISGVISRIVLGRLTVRRALPDAAVVGQPATVGYEFENGKRFWPSLSVHVVELDGSEGFKAQPYAYLLHAAAKTSASIKVEVTPKRRGLHQLSHFQIATSFPFGFIKRAVVRQQEDSIVVFPALTRMDQAVLRLLRSAETAGVTVKPRRGGEDEVFGIKEYRPGENPRLIHWKRSARTGQIVTREMTRVSPPRVMILCDTYLVDDTIESRAAVERAIAVAASLASEALQLGMMVGLVAHYGFSGGDSGGGLSDMGRDRGFIVLQPNRGKRHRRDVLTALAQLGENTRVEARLLIEHGVRGLRAGTTPVLVTAGEAEQSLGDAARGTFVTLSAGSSAARAWFAFPPEVDFEQCMPLDQQPLVGDGQSEISNVRAHTSDSKSEDLDPKPK